ncbi:MAG TPA: AAA family ATPase, partial [Chloroflexota bacterium]|nr:AAA family ATPase [Chloroflexota bacterium]
MKIDRLEVNGFGRLRGHDLKFGPTINVIAGPNEAGKSTLAEALQALLFGLTDGATSPAPNKLRQQFKPWNEGQFGGSIWVRLQNDRDYRIVRNFSQSATKVYREPGATDVTNQYISGKHGWVDFADRHLGMSRSVFRVSGWIDQAQLFYTSQQRVTLTGQLNNLVGAPNDGMSAQDALARLSNWLRDRINPAAHAVENSPYRKAERRVLELRAELEQSRDVLEELDQLIVDQRALEEKLQDDEVDLARIDALLAARELADIQKKLTRLATIEKDLTDIRTALKELDDVAQLEPRWFTAADQALADVERGKAGVETAQGVVAGEREAYESALGELEKIDQD